MEFDRQILTEEEATSTRLLARIIQSVGREVSRSGGGLRCLYLEVEAADLVRFGPGALRRLQKSTRNSPAFGPGDPDSQRGRFVVPMRPSGPRWAESNVYPSGLAGTDSCRDDDHLGFNEPLLVVVNLTFRIGLDQGGRLGQYVADGAREF